MFPKAAGFPKAAAGRVAIMGAGLALVAAAGTGVAIAGADAPAGKPVVGAQNVGQTHPATSGSFNVAPGGVGAASVTCPIGTLATGGGGGNNSSAGNVVITDSVGSGDRTWNVWVRNFGPTAQTFYAFAICAPA